MATINCYNICSNVKLVNVMSYVTQYSILWIAQSALDFTPWQNCSFERQVDFSRKHPATLQLMRDYYSYINIQAVYSQLLNPTAE